MSGAFSLGSSSSPASSKSDFVSLQTEGVKITHKQWKHKAKNPLQSVYLLAGLLITAEEDDGTDDDQNGGDGNYNTNDGT